MKTTEQLNTTLESYKSTEVTVNAIVINHRPHPYMVGPRHVGHAADNHGGMLGEATLKAIPCAHPKCDMMYYEHTYDTVLAVTLLQNLTPQELEMILHELATKLFKEDDFDGFIFIESDFEIIG